MSTRALLALLAAVTAACSSAASGGPQPPPPTGDDQASVDASSADSPQDVRDLDAPVEAQQDAGPDGQVLFVGDFETGDLTQWKSVEECAKGRISVYANGNAPPGAPPPVQGKYAAHFHVLDADVSPCTSTGNPRAQLSTAPLFMPGDDDWEHWSLYVPSDFPALGCDGGCKGAPYVLFQEDYGPPYDGSPSIGWDILSIGGVDSLCLSRGAQYGHDTPWHTPLVKGKWLDWLVHKKFANTLGGGGFVEAWLDGQPLVFAGMFPSADLYFDDVRLGTTRSVVYP